MSALKLEERINALAQLGQIFRQFADAPDSNTTLNTAVDLAFHKNGWFTREMTLHAIEGWGKQLTRPNIQEWAGKYPLQNQIEGQKKIALIMAGNIPLVGLHDLLAVILSGNIAVPKFASQDDVLMRFVVESLAKESPGLGKMITPAPQKLVGFDAVIATGSNNTQRYFDYYFGNVPHVFRRNRSSIAILDGSESAEELEGLMDDIFMYFGLGCRNVSKIFVPQDYDLNQIFKASLKYQHLAEHKKYMNNFAYYQSIFMLERQTVLENGLLILKEDKAFATPVSVLNYSRFNKKTDITGEITNRLDQIQAVAGHGNLSFGALQRPTLTDYADGIDTVQFLLSLNSD